MMREADAVLLATLGMMPLNVHEQVTLPQLAPTLAYSRQHYPMMAIYGHEISTDGINDDGMNGLGIADYFSISM